MLAHFSRETAVLNRKLLNSWSLHRSFTFAVKNTPQKTPGRRKLPSPTGVQAAWGLVKPVGEVVKPLGFVWFAESLDDFRYGRSIKVKTA